jgi:ribosomal protein S4
LNKNFKKSWILRFFLKIYKKRIERRWRRLRRYIYRIDIIDLIFRKKKYNKRWLSIRFTRLYFLTLQDHQFRQLFKKAQKLTGNLNTNYCHLLEGRLLPIFYRTNFLASLFVIINFIKNKNVLINFKKVTYVNTLVNIGSFLTFKKKLKRYMFSFLYKRILVKAVLFNRPRYLFISYLYAFAYILKKFKKSDLVYPINLDIQRISGYY